MPTVTVGDLTGTFDEGWRVSKYDEWGHYRNQFIKVCEGVKAVDVLALEPKVCCWLVEVKDYRRHARTKPSELAEEVAEKVRDTVAGLVGAQFCAADETKRKSARQALRSRNLRVVLHVEQPAKHSRLFPRAINLATVLQRLKQLIKAIDPHPRVVEMTSMAGIPWTVS
jgi:hypothetical protein